MNNDGSHVHNYEEAYSVILHVFAAPPTPDGNYRKVEGLKLTVN